MNAKVYVDVRLDHTRSGVILPLQITWEDGKIYEIERIVDVRSASAQKAGGHGERYTVIVNGRQSYLFFERSPNLNGSFTGRWFVERRHT